jgi:hypothetical protein
MNDKSTSNSRPRLTLTEEFANRVKNGGVNWPSNDELRSLLRVHGKLSPQASTLWKGPFDLPVAISDFYRSIGPVDIGIKGQGDPYFIPSLSRLWKHQVGYRVNGRTGKRIEQWPNSWVVVADQGADPFIYDRESGNILHDYHGLGSWEPSLLFDNIRVMAAALALPGSVKMFRGTGASK